MRIDAGAGYVLPSQRVQSPAEGVAGASSAPNTLRSEAPASGTAGLKQVDFTNMTRQGLFDWMNAQIRSGEMSLDESSAFLGMTLKMPVGGATAGLDAQEKLDFMQLAQAGIDWARQRNETSQMQALQNAMRIMQHHQGDSIGVDVHA